MKKQKQAKKKHAHQKSTETKWLEFIKRDDLRLTIPIGPGFQAELPEWTGSPHKKNVHNSNYESDSSKWLGTKVWPIESKSTESDMNIVGRGRPNFCLCMTPGSVECIKRHVAAKRIQLQADIGPAFWQWKFDEMGEEVSKLWKQEEQKKFEVFVRMNPTSKGKSFMMPAMKSFPLQSRKSIASYYFNVYVPKRIGYKTRSGCPADTDDEEGESPNPKGFRKRLRDDGVTSLYSSKRVTARYLTGCR